MEQINNENTIKESSNVLGYQVQNTPMLDTSKILLVADVNPKLLKNNNFIKTSNKTTTGSMTVLASTSTTEDTYITGLIFGFAKDATCDIANGTLNILGVINGASTTLGNLPLLTLTAQSQSIYLNFINPIKLDRGTAITSSSTAHTVGTYVKSATIFGYTQ